MRKGTPLRMALLLAAALLALAPAPGRALAAGVVGDGTAASCTEAALAAAVAGGGLVVFDCGGPATIPVSAELAVAGDSVVDGGGLITLIASGATRIFNVASGGSLALRHIQLTGGDAGTGNGGAVLSAGTLQVSDSTIVGSQANAGGAIATTGDVTLNRVTLSANVATVGGALYVLGPGGSADLANVTASGNVGTNGGGAIYNFLGAVSVRSSTLDGNSADGGGGAIYNVPPPPPGAAGSVTVQGSILGQGALGTACIGAITSQGSNIATDASCGLAAAGDRESTNPVLGPLADNGGPTQSRLPLAGSPALDAADATGCLSEDQRGLPRPFGPGCDIGAVEVQQAYGALTGPWYVAPAGSDSNPCNLPAAPCKTIAAAVAKASPGDVVNVAVGLYTAAAGEEVVKIAKKLTVSGGWDPAFSTQVGLSTVSGRIDSLDPPRGQRGITVLGGAEVTLVRMLVQGGGGVVPSPGGSSVGGGIFVTGTLHAVQVEVTGNAAELGGGIAVSPGSTAYLRASAVHANLYTNNGGGIYAESAYLGLFSSTVSSQYRLASTVGPHFEGTEIDISKGNLAIIGSTVVSLFDDPTPYPTGTAFAIRNNAASVLIWQSVLSGNQPCQLAVGATSYGGNVETKNTCGLTDPTDQPSTDPLLRPLAANGGPTPTHALPLVSPARDVTKTCAMSADQRGVAHPLGLGCDAGAYEYQGSVTSVLALPYTGSAPLGIASSRGLLKVHLPSGSAATPATLEIVPRDDPPSPPSSGRAALASFDMRVYSASGPLSVRPSLLGAPATVTVTYRDLPAGVAAGSLALAWYDEAAGVWRELPTVVSAQARTATAQTTRTGTFALVGGPWRAALPVVVR